MPKHWCCQRPQCEARYPAGQYVCLECVDRNPETDRSDWHKNGPVFLKRDTGSFVCFRFNDKEVEVDGHVYKTASLGRLKSFFVRNGYISPDVYSLRARLELCQEAGVAYRLLIEDGDRVGDFFGSEFPINLVTPLTSGAGGGDCKQGRSGDGSGGCKQGRSGDGSGSEGRSEDGMGAGGDDSDVSGHVDATPSGHVDATPSGHADATPSGHADATHSGHADATPSGHADATHSGHADATH